MKIYQSYMFRAKDPVIDELRTLMQDTYGRHLSFKHYAAVEEGGGPVASTLYAMFDGKTRRPQSATVEAIGRTLGYKRVWQKMNGRAK
jgi:hypothetical protein